MKIFYHGEISDALKHLAAMAECFGVETECVEAASLESILSAAKEQSGVVLDVASLARRFDPEQLERLAAQLKHRDLAVLLLIRHVNDSDHRFLQTLSGEVVRGVERRTEAVSVRFTANAHALVGELASFSYARKRDKALAFVTGPGAGAEMIMSLDDAPAFVRTRVGQAHVFLWCTDDVFDVHRPLAAEREFEEAADQYIPAIVFLRFAFRDRCWHNPSPAAGIVIDDPLLRRRYGFIQFPELLASAKRHGYRVTLAFIPWNHWRSRPNQVRLFRDYTSSFSVCAHGCDHTNNEFKSADYEELLRKNFVASQRMEDHAKRIGLDYEPLMVCPQEQYSLEAMRAFADSRRFMGLMCTACMPRGLISPQISGADLLLPAQDSFFGFPVFKRHYSGGDLSVFAMSLFLGKNAILVEHHEFFRNGPGGAEKFAAGLTGIHPEITWAPLADAVTQTHLRRRAAETRWEVRFFTDTFVLSHKSETPMDYKLIRRMPDSTVIRRVTVDGTEIGFSRGNGFLAFEIRLDRPQTIRVRIEAMPVEPKRPASLGIKYQVSVAFRRGLSELRDNVIARNGFALRAGRLLAKTFRQTAD
ncbi:MAG TPA: hypothetical protein VMA35_10110 [Candidatus Sulfopaludibacter sp.]|nr:hypothetical protein [Candidatus Sulfopaludibacter sp.]